MPAASSIRISVEPHSVNVDVWAGAGADAGFSAGVFVSSAAGVIGAFRVGHGSGYHTALGVSARAHARSQSSPVVVCSE